MKHPTRRSRAIDEQEKAARRLSILEAARALYLLQPTQLPSVISIAQQAGLAKGTVYLYFKTKEEIFLDLLGALYQQLLQELTEVADDREKSNEDLIGGLINQTTRFVQEHPHFMPLASMTSSILERNVEAERVADFKAELMGRIQILAVGLRRHLPQLTETQCLNLLLHTNALLLGLWQMQSVPAQVKEVLTQRNLDALVPAFEPALRESMTLLWRGVLQPA
ncbi:TetR family transcriptional regulator [Hahella sp. KA22]|uniref:TetR family transcriptional regulator n=1 Tax=Hahella sp. KA22 TaxID=1628392 RepID=UPI000FDF1F24|nr:TetR family transcriptional regulator [Hahella sp. KA22]AZZ93727.1 TetR/AcrR family transcriptional regulator [Hahella sp. KA22]QAY57102.1 TetR family transcriptional regulator [Hahella sp. KA22]